MGERAQNSRWRVTTGLTVFIGRCNSVDGGRGGENSEGRHYGEELLFNIEPARGYQCEAPRKRKNLCNERPASHE